MNEVYTDLEKVGKKLWVVGFDESEEAPIVLASSEDEAIRFAETYTGEEYFNAHEVEEVYSDLAVEVIISPLSTKMIRFQDL